MSRPRADAKPRTLPKRLMVLPRDSNPYQESLYQPLRGLGWRTHYLGQLTSSHTTNLLLLPVEVAVFRALGWRLVHVHWLFGFALPGSRRHPCLRHASALLFRTFLLTVRLLGVRVVWSAHNVLPHRPVFPDDQVERRRLTQVARLVIAHSAWTFSELERIGVRPKRRMVLEHPGPSRAPVATSPPVNRRRELLFFGRVEPYKGVEDLLEVLATLEPETPLRLTVAGACCDQDYRTRLEGLASQSALPIRLHLDYVSDVDVDGLFAACDVVVLPFREITTSGSAVLALSHGRPLLVPRLPPLATLPDLACFRYDPGLDGLREAIVRVAQLPSYDLRRAARAATIVNRLTWWEAATVLNEQLVGL